VQLIKIYLYRILPFGVMILMIFACTKEPEITNDPDPVPDPTSQIDPDILSEHLVLQDANKITGSLPTASDGGIKIDVRDTIYVVKGYPFGNRIQVLPQSDGQGRIMAGDISGMYVQVVGSEIYYDTPGGAEETHWIDEFGDHHTTYTFNLDLDLTDMTDVTYPLSTEVILQPHDEAGTPLDEFERTIVVEDPENIFGVNCNDIRRPVNAEGSFWEWEFTIRNSGSGDAEVLSAPGLFYDLGDIAGGCCNDICNCTIWPPYPGCNDQSATYVEMHIDPYYMPIYEFLWLWDDGRAQILAQDIQNNFDRSNSNVCTGEVAYLFNDETDDGEGTHDFTPGATTLTLDFPNFSGFARPFRQSEIIYTCNTLIMIQSEGEGGGEIGKVYKLFVPNDLYDPYAFEKLWFD